MIELGFCFITDLMSMKKHISRLELKKKQSPLTSQSNLGKSYEIFQDTEEPKLFSMVNWVDKKIQGP